MSKSILIIDIPESCAKCPLFFEAYTDMTCRANGRTIDYPFPSDRVSEWCPLKQIPQKLAEENRWFSKDYAVGYNACIHEILRECDENERKIECKNR